MTFWSRLGIGKTYRAKGVDGEEYLRCSFREPLVGEKGQRLSAGIHLTSSLPQQGLCFSGPLVGEDGQHPLQCRALLEACEAVCRKATATDEVVPRKELTLCPL